MTTNQDVTFEYAYKALLEKHGSDKAIINALFRDGQKQYENVMELETIVDDLEDRVDTAFVRFTKLTADHGILQKSWDRLDNELGETVEALIKSNRELDTYRAKASILKGRLAEYEAADHMGDDPFPGIWPEDLA